MKPCEPAAITSRRPCLVRHHRGGVVAAGLLGLLLLVCLPACSTRLDTHDMGVGVTPLIRHAEDASGLDVGVTVSGPEVELALDPVTGLADLIRGESDPAVRATSEATGLADQLRARIAEEITKGAEANQAQLEDLTAALTALRQGLSDQAGQPAAPLHVEPPPIGGGPVAWVVWALAAGIGVVGWLRGRKALSATLAAAIARAKDLLASYDSQPFTPSDVESIEAAKRGEAKAVG